MSLNVNHIKKGNNELQGAAERLERVIPQMAKRKDEERDKLSRRYTSDSEKEARDYDRGYADGYRDGCEDGWAKGFDEGLKQAAKEEKEDSD